MILELVETIPAYDPRGDISYGTAGEPGGKDFYEYAQEIETEMDVDTPGGPWENQVPRKFPKDSSDTEISIPMVAGVAAVALALFMYS